MPRLKVCGITDAAFAVEAARRGVDYLGLIFAEGSPRRVTPEQAKAIVAAVAGATMSPPRFVGVFVEQDIAEIGRLARAVPLDVIQLHGDYGAEEIAELKAPARPLPTQFSSTDARERNAAGPARAPTGRRSPP